MDYDKEGRLRKQIRTFEGQTYAAQRTYDAGGYLKTITYPDNDAIGTLSYDKAGRLYSIPGIVNSVTYDASGRPLVQSNANTTVTTKTHSPTRGFLQTIFTSGATTVQDITYNPDATGRLNSVTSTAAPNSSWTYLYDDLYRLTSADNATGTTNDQTWTYDDLGRITYNSRIGTYTYPADGPGSVRPHFPTAAGPKSFTQWDANGNLVNGDGRTYTWNVENRPTQITSGGQATAFTYDGMGTRLKKAWPASAPTTTSLYPLGRRLRGHERGDHEVRLGAGRGPGGQARRLGGRGRDQVDPHGSAGIAHGNDGPGCHDPQAAGLPPLRRGPEQRRLGHGVPRLDRRENGHGDGPDVPPCALLRPGVGFVREPGCAPTGAAWSRHESLRLRLR
jgi:YD repeat-containing protein